MSKFTAITFILLCPFLAFSQLKGKVITVKDGDTIVLLDSSNTQTTIRLASIDCPEKSQAVGQVAKKYTSDKCLGKNVKVSITTIDKYGRSVGFIILPNRDTLNNEIIKAGLAWHYVKYSNSKRLTDLESDAKAHKRGLWIDANPIEPWVFRKMKKS